MPSALEKLEATVRSMNKGEVWKEPKAFDSGKFNPESAREINSEVISADSVKGWVPHLNTGPKKEIDKLRDMIRGYEAPSRVVKVPRETVPQAGTSALDKLIKLTNGAPIGPTASVEGDYEGTSAMERVMEALQSETAKDIFTVLGFDEHYMVKGLESSLNKFGSDYKQKEHLGDYTWGNFLRESGLPDNGYTTSLGLGMSIFLSPTTYLTLGTSKTRLLAHVPKELGGLSVTKYGKKILDTTTKQLVDERVVKEIAKQNRGLAKAGKELLTDLPDNAVNNIARQAQKDVHMTFLKEFGPSSHVTEMVKSAKDVKTLVKKVGNEFELDDIVEFSGLKLEIPNTVFGLAKIPKVGGKQIKLLSESPLRGADLHLFGKKVLSGEEVAKIAHKAKIPQFAEFMADSPIGEGARVTSKWFRELFDTHYKAPDSVIDAFMNLGVDNKGLIKEATKKYGEEVTDAARLIAIVEDAEMAGNKLKDEAFSFAKEFYKGLNKKEKDEFSEVMIQASVKQDKIPYVKSFTGNAKVQDRIDAFVGQGKYKGTKSLSQELAEKSKVLELGADELPNWYMGIMKYLDVDDIKFNSPLGDLERKYLRQRQMLPSGDPKHIADYTRNPVQALSVRMAQIGYHDIHEKVFDRIKELNLGRAIGDEKLSISQLKKAGYKRLESTPFAKLKRLNNAPDDVIPKAEAGHFVQPDFADHYNTLTRKAPLPTFLQPLNFVTNLWKGSVTRAFPAFHARNFQSNIVMNAMRIGGHAIDVPKNMKALRVLTSETNPFRIAREQGRRTGTFARKMNEMGERAYDFITGKVTDKEWVSEIGERLSNDVIRKEARELGLLNVDQFVEDIGGVHLSIPGQNRFSTFLNRALNPLSKEFLGNVAGGKFGRLIEDQARLVNYMTWRSRGLSPKLALKEVNEALFDYGAITNFERNARVFIPFYTFNKKNLVNHMKVLAHRPGAITSQLKFFRDIGPDNESLRELYPEWAGRKWGNIISENLVVGYGVPMEDLIELAEDPLQQSFLRMAPYMRYGIEKASNRDFFSGRELAAVNNANEFKFSVEWAENENHPDWFRKPFKELNNFLGLMRDPSKKSKIIGDPDKLHILRSSFTSRWQSMFGQLQKEDQEMMVTAIRFLTGHVIIKPDAKLQQAIAKSKSMKEIQEMALKGNIARPIGFFFAGGSKPERDLFNGYMKEILKGGSVKKQRQIREKARRSVERIQERRFGD